LPQAAQVGAGGVEVFAVDFDHAVVDRFQTVEVRSRVDLPEPLRPMIATTWPSSTSGRCL
jgi:hypothetical protein